MLLEFQKAEKQMTAKPNFSLEVEETDKTCPVGQKVGKRNMAEGKILVLSCEGGCIRGEIARVAANLVAKEEPYRWMSR